LTNTVRGWNFVAAGPILITIQSVRGANGLLVCALVLALYDQAGETNARGLGFDF
jgi:hypothetical protein